MIQILPKRSSFCGGNIANIAKCTGEDNTEPPSEAEWYCCKHKPPRAEVLHHAVDDNQYGRHCNT